MWPGALRDIFVAIYPELGDIQGERIRKTIKESFIEHGWDDPNADTPSRGMPAKSHASVMRFVKLDLSG